MTMAMWRVRDLHADDLDAAIRLWDNPAASGEAPTFGLSDLIAAARAHQPAKGAASRLGWPFVELFSSRLAGESAAGLAAALREAFAIVAELDKVLLFIGLRAGHVRARPRGGGHG